MFHNKPARGRCKTWLSVPPVNSPHETSRIRLLTARELPATPSLPKHIKACFKITFIYIRSVIGCPWESYDVEFDKTDVKIKYDQMTGPGNQIPDDNV